LPDIVPTSCSAGRKRRRTHADARPRRSEAGKAAAGGSVSGLIVDLAGLQIGDALVLYITGDHRIPIRCALGRLKFHHGVVAFDKILMDTEKSVLHFDGQALLKTQEITSKITADTKRF
jgi:AsmA family protein